MGRPCSLYPIPLPRDGLIFNLPPVLALAGSFNELIKVANPAG